MKYLCGLILAGLLGSNLFIYFKNISKVSKVTNQLAKQINNYNKDMRISRLKYNKLASEYTVLSSDYNSLKSSYTTCRETVKQKSTEIELQSIKTSKEEFKYEKDDTNSTNSYSYIYF